MSDSQFRGMVALAVVLTGSAVYLNTFDGQWVWDDVSSVLLHKSVQAPARLWHGEAPATQDAPGSIPGSILQLFREDQHAYGRGQGNFYRPLVSLNFALDFFLAYRPGVPAEPSGLPALSAFVFHGSNLAWHLAAACLMLALLHRWKAPRFVQMAAPLLFVAHPLHTEAVAYISGRADMMSAALVFAALVFAFSEAAAPRRQAEWALALLCLAGALCAKESSAIAPLLALAVLPLSCMPFEAGWKKRLLMRALPVLALGVVALIYLALRSTVLKFAPGQAGAESPFGQRLFEALQAFALYGVALFMPSGLHMERSLAGVPAWVAGAGALMLAGCVALLVAAVRQGWRGVAMGMAWFLIAWLPISGLFPLNAPMAEHWMYVPMAGFWWAMTELLWMGAARFRDRRPWTEPVAACAVLLLLLQLCGLSAARNNEWGSNERLFRATLRENADTFRVHYNLAVAYQDLLGNPAGARRHYQDALRLILRAGSSNPSMASSRDDVEVSLGKTLLAQRDYPGAARYFGAVLERRADPAYAAEAVLGLGKCLLALGNLGPAHHYLEQAARINPALQPEAFALLEGAPIR